jgi:hypothetical protein
VPTSPKANFAKYRDVTQIQIHINISMYSTVASTVVEIGGGLIFPDATQTDLAIFHRAFNAATDHRDIGGGITTPGLTLPAGSYSVVARWRRVSGTGTLTMDANDSCTVWAREVIL